LGIHQLELALFNPKQSNIGRRAHVQRSQSLDSANHLSRAGSRAQQHIVKAHAEMEEFRHRRGQIVDWAVHIERVNVGRDCVWQEPSLHGLASSLEVKAAYAMANVKQHSSSSSFPDARLNLSIRVDDAQSVSIVTMGHDV